MPEPFIGDYETSALAYPDRPRDLDSDDGDDDDDPSIVVLSVEIRLPSPHEAPSQRHGRTAGVQSAGVRDGAST